MSYSLILITIPKFRNEFINSFKNISYSFNIPLQQKEDLYDWLIFEALSSVLNLKFQGRVKNHYRHDVYRGVYESMGLSAELYINEQLILHGLTFIKNETVKLLVAGDTLIIARGVFLNV